jgi:hypothetical protein
MHYIFQLETPSKCLQQKPSASYLPMTRASTLFQPPHLHNNIFLRPRFLERISIPTRREAFRTASPGSQVKQNNPPIELCSCPSISRVELGQIPKRHRNSLTRSLGRSKDYPSASQFMELLCCWTCQISF